MDKKIVVVVTKIYDCKEYGNFKNGWKIDKSSDKKDITLQFEEITIKGFSFKKSKVCFVIVINGCTICEAMNNNDDNNKNNKKEEIIEGIIEYFKKERTIKGNEELVIRVHWGGGSSNQYNDLNSKLKKNLIRIFVGTNGTNSLNNKTLDVSSYSEGNNSDTYKKYSNGTILDEICKGTDKLKDECYECYEELSFRYMADYEPNALEKNLETLKLIKKIKKFECLEEIEIDENANLKKYLEEIKNARQQNGN